MGLHRIPRSDKDFDQFINGSADYLQKVDTSTSLSNWERLDLLADEMTEWEDFRTGWNDSYGTCKTNLNRGIRDSSATKTKNAQRKAFTKWALDPRMNKLNRIKGAVKVTAKDRAVFNIRLREKNPGPRPAITTTPAVGMRAGGGGIIIITCRVESDSDRASRHPHADTIEMKYIIMDAEAKPPTSAKDCPSTYYSTRAIFRFEEVVGHPGKRLHAFLRWRNSSDPSKSGPWSQRKTTIIGD